jgi:hypothetical protein
MHEESGNLLYPDPVCFITLRSAPAAELLICITNLWFDLSPLSYQFANFPFAFWKREKCDKITNWQLKKELVFGAERSR